MRRREVIRLLAGATATWPLAARAQQQAMPAIGVLYGVSASQWTDRMAAFRRGLGETGFVEGRNVVIEGEFEYQIKKIEEQDECVVRESQLRANPAR